MSNRKGIHYSSNGNYDEADLNADYMNQNNGNVFLDERPFKDMHHPIVRAIWNVDRFNPKIDEKLKELRNVINKYNPEILCDILHDVTGLPIAQATPLLISCFEGDPDVIKLLIDSNVDVNVTESEHHLTPLHVICDAEYHGQSLRQKDRAEIVRLLVKHNANVNHLDRNSMAALHKAVIHDRPECVNELMQAKADPNVCYMGDTPLSIASRHNREKICKVLLNFRETNVNHRNDQGGTPLHFACAALVDSPTCVEMLINNGAKLNVQDHKKNTPAMVAAFFNKPNILRYLIEQGADLSLFNNEDKDAYKVADEKDHFECKTLISRNLEKLGIHRTSFISNSNTNTSHMDELSRNFEIKNRIR